MKTKLTLIGALLATLVITETAQAARRYARPAGTTYRAGAPQVGKPIGPLLRIKEAPLAPSAPLILPEPIPRDEPTTSIEVTVAPPVVETVILPRPTFDPTVFQ